MKIKSINLKKDEPVGERLRHCRLYHNLLQVDILNKGNLSMDTITCTENGKNDPKVGTILSYVKALGIRSVKVHLSKKGTNLEGNLETIGLQLKTIREKNMILKGKIPVLNSSTISNIENGKNVIYRNLVEYASFLNIGKLTINT